MDEFASLENEYSPEVMVANFSELGLRWEGGMQQLFASAKIIA